MIRNMMEAAQRASDNSRNSSAILEEPFHQGTPSPLSSNKDEHLSSSPSKRQPDDNKNFGEAGRRGSESSPIKSLLLGKTGEEADNRELSQNNLNKLPLCQPYHPKNKRLSRSQESVKNSEELNKGPTISCPPPRNKIRRESVRSITNPRRPLLSANSSRRPSATSTNGNGKSGRPSVTSIKNGCPSQTTEAVKQQWAGPKPSGVLQPSSKKSSQDEPSSRERSVKDPTDYRI